MLLFLHGFLGDPSDWNPLLSHLPSSLPCCTPTLPCHGNEPISEDIIGTIHHATPKARCIVGYSAGGRAALELKARYPESYGFVIVLSAHPGLEDSHEKKIRWETDKKWINMLQGDSFEGFLEAWYKQDLFQSFRQSECFEHVLACRHRNDPKKLAHFLNVFSLGKKIAPKRFQETLFVCGEEDLKYAALYHTLFNIHFVKIKGAGHVVHLEKPKVCAELIVGAIHDPCRFFRKSGELQLD